jgi:hypothetical protein
MINFERDKKRIYLQSSWTNYENDCEKFSDSKVFLNTNDDSDY